MINPVRAEAFEPEWAEPPGTTIRAILHARSISKEALAHFLGADVQTVQRLLLGVEALDENIAIRLSECLGSSRTFWMAREAEYRSDIVRVQQRNTASDPEFWVKQFPSREMATLGWIGQFRSRTEAADRCLAFFGVPDVPTWQARYAGTIAAAAFRISGSTKKDPGAVIAWLRWAELAASRVHCDSWDASVFRERLRIARRLTWQKDPRSFIPKLRLLCAEAGVALVVARTPKGCPASGATHFLSPEKAMLVLSFRYRSDDQFWFTFFHEAAHLLLHRPGTLFLEGGDSDASTSEEREANDFAASVLVPPAHQDELLSICDNLDSILRFASRAGVAPGLIVGQLQHKGLLGRDRLNRLKRRYSWDQIEADGLIP
ncbi:ImmA/IrrE family metallo-endopeptidase [uncultured Enterovirga sp.]|uniref:ImmA/IrrE family metallo-endopeptidase n=1 Tax=uncultured Enterovirga sp. TaxID=2026352 RepID=UPI0035CB503B